MNIIEARLKHLFSTISQCRARDLQNLSHEEVFIAPSILQLLSRNGLVSFQSFMRCEGTIVSRGSHKIVLRLQLEGSESCKPVVFFLKCTLKESWKKACLLLLRGVRPRSASVREMQLTQKLCDAGFDVMPVLAWGERRVFGVPKQGFLLAGEVNGCNLDEIFERASTEKRLHSLSRYGHLVGRLHALGFFHSLRLKDLIVSPTSNGESKWVIIDRDVTSPWPKRFTSKQCIRALGRCYRKFCEHFEFKSWFELLSFCRGYRQGLGKAWKTCKPSLFKQIKRRLMATAPVKNKTLTSWFC